MTSADSLQSSRRESLVEHVFIGKILQSLWCAGVHEVDVLRAETDAAGYDLVIEVGEVARHVQLKSSLKESKTSRQKIHLSLGRKPSGCVVWVVFRSSTMEPDHFLWFGGAPGEPLPDLSDFPVAKHTKANSEGFKAERQNICVIKKKQFLKIDSIDGVIDKLFGRQTFESVI